MRKQTYKGTNSITHSLPIDAVSTIGIAIVLGAILPATSLSNECVQSCRNILLSLEGSSPVKELEIPLSGDRSMKFEARSGGKFKVSEIKPLWKKLGLNFQRPGIWVKKHFHVAISSHDLGSKMPQQNPFIQSYLVFKTVPGRFQKKLPSSSLEVTLADILCGMLRTKGDAQNQDLSSPYHGLLKRLVHTFAQAAEQHLEQQLLSSCPDPQVNARVHPFLKSSRSRGNKALEMNLAQRFAARGSGYVSLKDSNLHELGVVSKKSSLGTRTSAEFACRVLMKTASHFEQVVSLTKNINFCFDAAMVSEQSVSWFMNLLGNL